MPAFFHLSKAFVSESSAHARVTLRYVELITNSVFTYCLYYVYLASKQEVKINKIVNKYNKYYLILLLLQIYLSFMFMCSI